MTLRAGYRCDCGRTIEVTVKEYKTEVQPPQADMVQPLVGPPDAGRLSEEPAALARRQTIAEVKAYIKDERGTPEPFGWSQEFRSGWEACCDYITQHLDDL